MNPIKKIIIEETAKVLKEMKNRKKIKDVSSNLFEAVKTEDYFLKHVENSKSLDEAKKYFKKWGVAKKLVERFEKDVSTLKENHKYEDESEMAKAQLAAIIEKSKELFTMIDGVTQLEDWLQYKLSIAENYIDAIHGYIKYFNGENDMDDNRMEDDVEDEMEDDEMEWDDVDEEDYDEDAEYYDDDEDGSDFSDFDDYEFEDGEEADDEEEFI